MKTVQLIKRTETVLYFNNGILISEELTPSQKLHLSLFGETKIMIKEEVIDRWMVKNNKDADKRFWDYMTENKIKDTSDYYVIF